MGLELLEVGVEEGGEREGEGERETETETDREKNVSCILILCVPSIRNSECYSGCQGKCEKKYLDLICVCGGAFLSSVWLLLATD